MRINRRRFIGAAAAGAAALTLPGRPFAALSEELRMIPSSGEAIPAVGMGTWITFNVGTDPALRANCADVYDAFIDEGGGMLDSSPMYGSAQAVIGHAIEKRGDTAKLFSADKVWTSSGRNGPKQMEASREHWGVPGFDLLQIHNLVGWEAHLETLTAMKAAGQVRYIGITTSHGRRHRDFEAIMRSAPLDFIQLTYNAADREAERRLLPLARERGIGVIVNRPFQGGALIERARGTPLPGWAVEIGVASWAQALLKYILAHPAVTVAIPATSKVAHIREDKAAAHGPQLDAAMRRDIERLVEDF